MKKWKKMLTGLIATALMLSCAPDCGLTAKAADVSESVPYKDREENILFYYKQKDDDITITKYISGEIPNQIEGKDVTSIGEGAFQWQSFETIKIPNTVTSIGKNAFNGCSKLTSFTIPGNVTSIGEGAFSGCSSLTSIAVPSSVTSIGKSAFNGCEALNSVTISEGVKNISGKAFSGCSNLSTIIIPKSVTSIGYGVFSGCSALKTITVADGNNKYISKDGDKNYNAIIDTANNALISGCQSTEIPDGVTRIKSEAFSGCSDLASIEIPGSVKSIGDEAFSGCSGLAGIKIPDSVTGIGENAFSGCSGLTSIEIPDSVTSIGESAFKGCSSLAEITVANGNTKYDSRDDCNAIIDTASKALIAGCKETTIPDNVTSIDGYAFSGCNLKIIPIPDSVTSIGGGAFSDCKELERIILSDRVTSIGGDAFSGCSALETITIPNGVTSIWGGTFHNCGALTSVTIPASVKSIKDLAFDDNKLTIKGIAGSAAETYAEKKEFVFEAVSDNDIGWAAVTLERFLYGYDETAKEPAVTVELSGKKLVLGTDYDVAYSNNTNMGIAKVTITGKGNYSGNKEKEFIIGEATDRFQINADGIITKYTGTNKIVKIPSEKDGKQITGIGKGAFSGCKDLTEIEIPASVTSIGSMAFSGCSGLTKITVVDGNQKYDSRDNCNAIIDKNNKALILGCKSTEIPKTGVTSIGENAFSGCADLTAITIPEGMTRIGENAFSDCSGLRELVIPKSVTSIVDGAFSGCSGLTKIAVVDGNSKYDSRNNCNAIIDKKNNVLILGCVNTEIPDKVASIGGGAFSGCSGLTAITIPADVVSIGGDAFSGCSGLESITIPNGVEVIWGGTFRNCSSLNSVIIPPGVTNIDESAFYNCKNLTVYGAAGSAAETFAERNDFKFSAISDNDIYWAAVTLSQTICFYDGKTKTPSVKVELNGKVLTLDTDYTVSYSNNVNEGTAAVTVTGKGSYTGSKTVNFMIRKNAQSSSITCRKTLYKVAYGTKPFKINAASEEEMTFTSSKPEIAVVDKKTGKVTVKKTGIAVITVQTAKESVKVTVEVSPRKPSVKTSKVMKGKKLKVSWKKDKMASGYQVQVSTDKKFKKNVKSQKVTKTKVSYTFKKLKAGKKYYVRVRSYKKSGKKTLYSAWSKIKRTSKIKK